MLSNSGFTTRVMLESMLWPTGIGIPTSYCAASYCDVHIEAMGVMFRFIFC
jgi:hypothetical protein